MHDKEEQRVNILNNLREIARLFDDDLIFFLIDGCLSVIQQVEWSQE